MCSKPDPDRSYHADHDEVVVEDISSDGSEQSESSFERLSQTKGSF